MSSARTPRGVPDALAASESREQWRLEFAIRGTAGEKKVLATESLPANYPEAKGWIDPSPLWDTDGNAYLVHAFAGSRSGIKSVLVVNKMSPDGTRLFQFGGLDLSLLSTISLVVGVAAGTMGLPHILIRAFTVRDALAAQR